MKVTEVEPLVAYILSMNRFQDVADGVPADLLARLVDEAYAEVEKRLELGPIHITKSTGLFVAS